MSRLVVGTLLRNFGSGVVVSATPSLSVADNGDDTGATATIGNAAGYSVDVYTRQIGTTFSTGAWTLSGTRSGNGTVDLTLDAGHYFAYAQAGGATCSSLAYFVVTTGEESVEEIILNAVAARLTLLDTDGIDSENIVTFLQEPATLRDLPTKPAIAVYSPKPENTASGTNARDEVAYQVVVAVVDSVDVTTADADASRRSLWLQQISRAFRNQRLTGADTVYTCDVLPLDTPQRLNWMADGLWVSGHILKFTSREPRGM